jgi:hypothetical protein
VVSRYYISYTPTSPYVVKPPFSGNVRLTKHLEPRHAPVLGLTNDDYNAKNK